MPMTINRRMAAGAAWTLSLRLFNRGVGFISTLILARLLVPADFGLVAMATVLSGLLAAFSDFSVHVPLIQKKEIDREDMDSAWTLQVLVGLFQGGLLVGLAPLADGFYDEPRLSPIVYLLGGIAVTNGFRNIGVAMFQRDMNFRPEFVLMAATRIAAFVVTVLAAWIYRSYWALLAGMAAGAVVGLAMSYTVHPFRPRPSRKRLSALLSFSKWLVVNNVLMFVGRRGPDLVLGRLIGPSSVGIFSLGYEIATLPTTQLIAPINRAVLPGYARLRTTEGGLTSGYFDVLGMVALIGVPASLGISATADLLVPLLLGPGWLAVIPVVRLMGMAGAASVLVTNSGTVFLAVGRPQTVTRLLVFRLALLIPGVVLGAGASGPPGAAAAYLAVNLFMLMANLATLRAVLDFAWARLVKAIYRPVLSAVLMYLGLVWLLIPRLADTPHVPQSLIAVAAVVSGAVIYSAFVLGAWVTAGRPEGAERHALAWLGGALEAHVPDLAQRLLRLGVPPRARDD